eukprot:1003019-Alexandrium_andersonii.AAC.1
MQFEDAAGLQLNTGKCVIIPLWPGCCGNIANLIREVCPRLRDVRVAFFGKYLGLSVGPHAGTHAWDSCLVRFHTAVREIRALGLGLSTSLLQYASRGVGTVAYVASHLPPSREALEAQHHALQLLTCGPWHAIPTK